MHHIQLSETQTVILSTACAREDGLIFPVTAKLKGGAVGNVCNSLLKHGLIEEIVATDLNTVWRHDDTGPLTLRATPLAHSALGIGYADGDVPAPRQDLTSSNQRKSTKQEALIAMLRAEGGATIAEIVAALDWQPHSVRGLMSGVLKKKLGLIITSEKIDGRGRVYAIHD